jgi:hypothetical protein
MNQKLKKNIIYSLITGIFLFVAYLLFTPDKNKDSNLSYDSNQYSKNYNSTTDAIRDDLKENSVFNSESGFLDFSQSGEISENKDSKGNNNYYDPANISEEERAKRRKLTIERMKPLAELFPNNKYIPREYSKEELEKLNRKEEFMSSMQERILNGEELTPDERLYYFSEKKSDATSKLEIFNYAKNKLTELGKGSNPNSKIIEERLQSIESRAKLYEEEINTAKKSGGNLENIQLQ